MEEIEFKAWANKFGGLKPNTIDSNAFWYGALYNSNNLKEKLKIVSQISRDHTTVWTITKESDDYIIKPGYVLENRIGNFITRKAWLNKQEYKIKL